MKLAKFPLLFVCFLALFNLTMLAQVANVTGRLHVPETSEASLPPQDAAADLTTIYTNLGTKKDVYSHNEAWEILGPENKFQIPILSVAMLFTPESDSHVSQVQVAVQYANAGANQINLSIYEDINGIPKNLLAGPVTVTNLPKFASCCLLTVANFTPIAVTAGTKYWVVADTPAGGTGSDTFADWLTVANPVIPTAQNYDGHWSAVNADELVAGEVLGTTP